jgi:hypothetical protein
MYVPFSIDLAPEADASSVEESQHAENVPTPAQLLTPRRGGGNSVGIEGHDTR